MRLEQIASGLERVAKAGESLTLDSAAKAGGGMLRCRHVLQLRERERRDQVAQFLQASSRSLMTCAASGFACQAFQGQPGDPVCGRCGLLASLH